MEDEATGPQLGGKLVGPRRLSILPGQGGNGIEIRDRWEVAQISVCGLALYGWRHVLLRIDDGIEASADRECIPTRPQKSPGSLGRGTQQHTHHRLADRQPQSAVSLLATSLSAVPRLNHSVHLSRTKSSAFRSTPAPRLR